MGHKSGNRNSVFCLQVFFSWYLKSVIALIVRDNATENYQKSAYLATGTNANDLCKFVHSHKNVIMLPQKPWTFGIIDMYFLNVKRCVIHTTIFQNV